MLHVALARFGDVDGQVPDALQVGVDLHGRNDGAEVGGHGLMEGQELETAIVDLDVQVVDRFVAGDHGLQDLGLALHHRLHRHPHPLFRQAAHGEQALLERFELLLEMPNQSFHACS